MLQGSALILLGCPGVFERREGNSACFYGFANGVDACLNVEIIYERLCGLPA